MSRESAIAALYGAVVDDHGRRWGEIATDRQREDAEALLDPSGPRFHYLTRPRGGSKTTDLAAVRSRPKGPAYRRDWRAG